MASVLKTINRGVEYLQQGKPEQAAMLYRNVLVRHPGHPDALHLLSVATYQMGNVPEAVNYARRAISANPEAPDYHSNLGRFYLSLGQLEEARHTLEHALELRSDHPMAHLNLALALTQQGRLEEALSHSREYTSLQPADPGGQMAMGNLLADLYRHREASECYRRVIELNPNIAEAHNNLGNALQALGKPEESLPCYAAALRIRPHYPDAWSNKGAALQAMGNLQEAKACYEEALRQEPGLLQAQGNIANLLSAQGQHQEAIEEFRRILRRMPESVETWNNLGNCYQQLGRYEESLASHREALRLRPSYYLVHNNIGNTYRRLGRYQEAVAEYETALRADPQFVEAINNLGVTLQDMGQLQEAVQWFEKATSIQPLYVDPLINLANNWRERGQAEHSIPLLRRALELQPGNASTWNNLGCALGDQGLVPEAIDSFRRAMELAPANAPAHSNLLLNIHYLDTYTPEQIFSAHSEFRLRHEPPYSSLRKPHLNPPDPDRRLRVGYVSADFRRHSVAFFLEPVIELHDRGQFDVFCYADVTRPDAYTDRFRQLAGDNWRELRGYNDERFRDLIRSDQIDILIDLGGHTANSRLLSFASQPAPVQVSWLGYPDTTGVESIHYRITDSRADPVGETESWHTEELVRIPNGFLCFRPPADAPEVSAPPVAQGAPFTFGSFNNMAKVGPAVVRMWAEILDQVPGSRLAIKNKALSEPAARTRIQTSFAEHGIAPQRIFMAGLIDSLAGHLDAYRIVDLALDTWPYHGTTTTCEALWMGVPVITLAGSTHVSRVGVSLLDAVGLKELVAGSSQDYVALATQLAARKQYLAELRPQLRPRMRDSRLMDQPGFTRQLEEAYRHMWSKWCHSASHAKETSHG